MWRDLLSSANLWLSDLSWSLYRSTRPKPQRHGLAPAPRKYLPLQRVVLTDGVGRTLFEEYAAHRDGARGEEETGWLLLGLRGTTEAVVMATLPAGAGRDASVGHVRFNSTAQAVGSRIARQADRRLNLLGVVHTHPGSLRHPTDGDYRGDSVWVRQRRWEEGIFGIGTADAKPTGSPAVGWQPKPHVQCLDKLCLSWYALHVGDRNYRPLPVELTLGPDLARPLHAIWTTIEAHAERLDRLACQQVGVTFDVIPGAEGEAKALTVTIPLAEPGEAVRVLLDDKAVHYFVLRGDELLEADLGEDRVDQGVYLLLAELASQY